MKVAKGYKQTELGTIPEDWEVISLGQILKVKHGKSQHEVRRENGTYPILASGGEIGRTNTFLFDKPSVLIGRKGTIDKPQFIDEPFWSIDTLFYTDIKSIVNPKFIFYTFNRIDWYSYNEASGVPSLNAKTIEKIKILLPPTIKEQNTITNALNETDALIADLEKLIAKKQNIKIGMTQKLLTPKSDWVTIKLGDISEIRTGAKNNEDNETCGIYPFFVRSQNVKRINTYSFDGEAILIPGEGGIGTIIHYIKGRFDFHQRVYKISNFKGQAFGKFVYYYMMHNFFKHAMKNSVKATVDSLRLPTFQNFEIPFPSFKEQEKISEIIGDIEKEIEALEQQLSKYKLMKEGMMQDLLTGKVRLI